MGIIIHTWRDFQANVWVCNGGEKSPNPTFHMAITAGSWDMVLHVGGKAGVSMGGA